MCPLSGSGSMSPNSFSPTALSVCGTRAASMRRFQSEPDAGITGFTESSATSQASATCWPTSNSRRKASLLMGPDW